jgi:hypothetical protein
MDTALLTAETAVEVIGVIGVVITVGLMIYHIVEVFENPKSFSPSCFTIRSSNSSLSGVHKEPATPTFNVIKTLKIRVKKLNFIHLV